jgi:hypothetical protein
MSDDLNTKGLDKLIKALSDETSRARVGILSGKNQRRDQSSNATIGLKHEFGDDKVPMRSFLRAPITDEMQNYLEKSQVFTTENLKEVIDEKSLLTWIKKIGIIGETIVLDAFQSGGFGKWIASNMKNKKNHQTLVETQQLRNSITSEAK